MKPTLILFVFFFSLMGFTSCIVQSPKYAKIEQVLTLQEGMTKEEVSRILGIPPYDLRSVEDSVTILIYKYRVTDRKVLPFNMKPTNGFKATGKYVDLFVTYNREGKATYIRSCSDCEETREMRMKLDIDKVVTLMTVTLPLVIVFFGLN